MKDDVLELSITESKNPKLNTAIQDLKEAAKNSPYFPKALGGNVALIKIILEADMSYYAALLIQNGANQFNFTLDKSASIIKGCNFYHCLENGCFEKRLLVALDLKPSPGLISCIDIVWHTKWPEEIIPSDDKFKSLIVNAKNDR